MRIKANKRTDTIEILEGKNVLYSGNTQHFVIMSEKIMDFITKEKWSIRTDHTEARMSGIYKYNVWKNIVLSAWHDLKKKYGKSN
jgi:hypothetical protein